MAHSGRCSSGTHCNQRKGSLKHRTQYSFCTLTTCRDLDVVADGRERMEAALRGVFAGNIFDLGAAASSQLFNAAGGVRLGFKDCQ